MDDPQQVRTSGVRSRASRGVAWLIITIAACEFVIAWLIFAGSIRNRVFIDSVTDGPPQTTGIILGQELGWGIAAAAASGALIKAFQFLKEGRSGWWALGLLGLTICVWVITFALTVTSLGS